MGKYRRLGLKSVDVNDPFERGHPKLVIRPLCSETVIVNKYGTDRRSIGSSHKECACAGRFDEVDDFSGPLIATEHVFQGSLDYFPAREASGLMVKVGY